MQKRSVDELIEVIWQYHLLGHALEYSDCLLVLGSNDLRVAEFAADLYLEGWAPLLVFSGGFGTRGLGKFEETEAEAFAAIAERRGVPSSAMVLETSASNTGENVTCTRRLLSELGIDPGSFILVQKPFMERRSFATFEKHWPGKKVIVASPKISFAEYPNENLPREQLINTIVGDLQRIKLYAECGFQIPQEIPAEVWEASQELIARGYDRQLVKNVTPKL